MQSSDEDELRFKNLVSRSHSPDLSFVPEASYFFTLNIKLTRLHLRVVELHQLHQAHQVQTLQAYPMMS